MEGPEREGDLVFWRVSLSYSTVFGIIRTNIDIRSEIGGVIKIVLLFASIYY